MPTEVCLDIFEYPQVAIDIFNHLGESGYNNEQIFSIAAHFSFLCHGILNDTEKGKSLVQEAVEITKLLDSLNNPKLC